MEEEAREVGIDKDLKKKINETVKSILKRSSLYRITEIKAREEASTELNLDLSQDPYKLIVRNAVESFIEEAIATINNEMGNMKTEIGEDEEEGSETTTKKKTKKKKKKNKESGS